MMGGKITLYENFCITSFNLFYTFFFLWEDFISSAYTDIPWLTMFCLMIFHLYNGLKENCTLSFEYWSFSELVKHSTILSHDAFINVKMSHSSQPDRQSHVNSWYKLHPFYTHRSIILFTSSTVSHVTWDIQHSIIK